MLEVIALRARYRLGNLARLVSGLWRERQIAADSATSIFACGFGASGWHHLRMTLEEYDADPAICARDTPLWKFLREFKPASISALAAPGAEPALPIFTYPWGTFRVGEAQSAKDPWGSRFCGPSTDEFIEEEFTRFIALYREMRETGYRPTTYPHSHIGGTWLINYSGERRFVVLQGNHRMAILAHLGEQQIAVRTLRGYLPAVREHEADRWPLVISGKCSREHALAVFRLFFRESGQHVGRSIAGDC